MAKETGASELITATRAFELIKACSDFDAAVEEFEAALATGGAGAVARHASYHNNGGRAENVTLTPKHWKRISDASQVGSFWNRGSVDLPDPGAVKLSGIRIDRAMVDRLLEDHGQREVTAPTKGRRPTYEHGLPIAKVVIQLLEMPYAERKAMKAVAVSDLLIKAYEQHTKQVPHERNIDGIAGGIRAAMEGYHKQLADPARNPEKNDSEVS